MPVFPAMRPVQVGVPELVSVEKMLLKPNGWDRTEYDLPVVLAAQNPTITRNEVCAVDRARIEVIALLPVQPALVEDESGSAQVHTRCTESGFIGQVACRTAFHGQSQHS
jgi:hypothetical protein